MGRGPARTARVAFLSLAAAIILVLLSPYAVFAVYNNPDSYEIISAKAFRHLIETDDFLLVIHYDVHYNAGQPSDPINATFLARVVEQAGNTTIGSAIAYPYYNDGYDEGVVSLYWAASDAPAWGGNYTARFEGNPSHFTYPVSPTHFLEPADFVASTTQTAIRAELKAHIIDISGALEMNWGVPGDLYTESEAGTILALMGEEYFIRAIPGLRSMCPNLFGLFIVSPTVAAQTFDQAQASKYTARWDGTIIEDFIDGMGDFTGASGQFMVSMGCIVTFLAVVVVVIWRNHSATAGFLIGWPVLLIGTPAGFLSYTIMAVIGFVSVFLLGYFFAFRHGSG